MSLSIYFLSEEEEKCMLKTSKTMILTYAAMGIALNVVLGTVVSSMKIPLLFLDTIGTVLISVLFGPWWGALTGGLTNVVLGATTGASAIFFGIVNIAIALVAGYMARRFDFTKWYVALITGIILSIIAPLIGTPIAVAVYGGLNGSGMDLVVLWLRSTGGVYLLPHLFQGLPETLSIKSFPVF
jgi:energy-coupling factor transport system substrate-specific component